ncbi:MAG: phosphagen kinase [SAR324 cluster bacterium]|nr:phosphagen kinase [SAR324 cluster bacterium]
MSFPKELNGSHSYLAQHLTPEVWESLQGLETSLGFKVQDLISTGIKNPDSSVGLYLPDQESFALFAPLVEPVIVSCHKRPIPNEQPFDFPIESDLQDLQDGRILSTRIRVARNLTDFPLPSGLKAFERLEVEALVREACLELTGELKGDYVSVVDLSPEAQDKMRAEHLLFQEPDRFLIDGKIANDWPQGRGVFSNQDHSFMVWVNEEDHLRIMALVDGGALKKAARILATGLKALDEKLGFMKDDRLGYLASCPSNLGTGMRASVHAQLPIMAANLDQTKKMAVELGLQVRGSAGEHSDVDQATLDISNQHRLGLSELEILQTLSLGIKEILKAEEKG